MGFKSSTGGFITSARRNAERNEARWGETLRAEAGQGVRYVNAVPRNQAKRAGIYGGITVAVLGLAAFGANRAWDYATGSDACKTDYFEKVAEGVRGKPCRVPVMSGLELRGAGSGSVRDVVRCHLNTDTQVYSEIEKTKRRLEVEVACEPTTNYFETELANGDDPYPADQFNGLVLFGIYNNAIRGGGDNGSRASAMCRADIRDMLSSVRSNADWFANSEFPATQIRDANLVPHVMEGGVDSLEIAFVSRERLPQLPGSLPESAGTTTLPASGKRELTCGTGA